MECPRDDLADCLSPEEEEHDAGYSSSALASSSSSLSSSPRFPALITEENLETGPISDDYPEALHDMPSSSSPPSPPPPPLTPPSQSLSSTVDATSTLLASLRPSADPAYLQACISKLSVALRTSELQRGHLHLTCQALRNEQGRLQQHVQELAHRERELEEHCTLLGARDDRSLGLLRGQLLEAARAEASKAKKRARALAAKAQGQAEVQAEAQALERQSKVTALEEEVARLTSLLAQRAVLASAQVRQWEERDRLREAQVEESRALVAEVGVLKEQLARAEDGRALEAANRMEAEKKAEEECQASRRLQQKLEQTEALLNEAQQSIRELTSRLETTAHGEEEERFSLELGRMHKGFALERRRLEGEIESLRRELQEAQSHGVPSIMDFIEDDEDEGSTGENHDHAC